MKKKNTIVGIIIVIIGVFLLLHTLGFYSSNLSAILTTSQPLFFILAGLAFITRKPAIATIFLLLALVFGLLLVVPIADNPRIFIQQIESNDFESIRLNMNFGAGEIILSGQDQEFFLTNYVKILGAEPQMNLKHDGSVGLITINGNLVYPQMWNITLDKSLPIAIFLSYGAADANLDLTGLKVTHLNLAGGATNTKIRFPTYPMTAKINTAASNLALEFPRGVGASISIRGGAIDLNLQGFTLYEGKWINDWYDERSSIEIELDAGASSIQTSFFEAYE